MKRIIILIFIIFNFNTTAKNYLARGLYFSDGRKIEGENISVQHPIASITKLMSAVIVAEAVENGDFSFDDIVVVDRASASIGGSFIGLRAGERISLRDLFLASLLHSANNATHVMANYIAGSQEAFVELMNQKAQELAMYDTVFYTPSGLPSSMTKKGMDIGTVEDIAKLALYALDNEVIMATVALEEASIKNGSLNIRNRNKNLKVEGVDGLKTGSHDEAGFNIAVSVERGSLRYILVVLGSTTEEARDNQIESDIEYLYTNYRKSYLVNKDDFVVKVPVIDGREKYISLYATETVVDLISDTWALNKSVYVPKKIEAPIEAGSILGLYIVSHEGRELVRTELVAKEAVEQATWLDKLFKIFKR